MSGGWHEFAVEWSPERIVWEVDGRLYHEATPADVAPNQWVLEHPFFLLTDVAVGGDFGGTLGEDLELPEGFVVDYVRHYRLPEVGGIDEVTVYSSY